MTPTQNNDRLRWQTARELERIKVELADDPETAHSAADKALLKLLIGLGHVDIVAAWEAIPKWYA